MVDALKPSTRIREKLLIHKINSYRSIFILEHYLEFKELSPSWLQNIGSTLTTRITSADDPSIEVSSIYFSKITIPQVITLPDDLGVYRLTTSSGQKRIYKTTPDNLYLKISVNSEDIKLFHYFFRIENSLYIYPFIKSISGSFLFENPLDADVFFMEYILSGNLVPGEIYEVTDGTIIYEGKTYIKGSTFSCDGTKSLEFTGNGKVKKYVKREKRGVKNNYPIDRQIAQKCLLQILTSDYNIEMNVVKDVVQDQQDQLKILKSGL